LSGEGHLNDVALLQRQEADRGLRLQPDGHRGQALGLQAEPPGYYQARTDTDRKLRNHIRQIEALGLTVALTKAG
jgi:hypothetical protein